jgi:hypothetical protein
MIGVAVRPTIGTSIRTYANNNRYPWTPSHDRRPAIGAPTGITFVGYENPPGVSTDRRVQHFLESDRAGWYNHVNLGAHDRGGHFIPWEIPDRWVDDLRRTFRAAGRAVQPGCWRRALASAAGGRAPRVVRCWWATRRTRRASGWPRWVRQRPWPRRARACSRAWP